MIMKRSGILLTAALSLLLFSCKQKVSFNPDDVNILHQNEVMLTQTIIYDIFTPPVASRIYAYTSLAQYEAVKYASANPVSIAEKLNGFGMIPKPDKTKKYNYVLAGTEAFCKVAYNVKIFSVDTLKKYQDSLLVLYKASLTEDEVNNSIALGDTIGEVILARARTDMYKETRGMPKDLGSNDDGKWRPTPPDYADGVEPNWNKIKAFALDSANQFRPDPPYPYSKDSASDFYKMVKEVYTVNKNLTDEQKTIARYWDDNPFTTEHSGHLMYANKKITPGGHWMGITRIACVQSKADIVKTAEAYAFTSISLLDAFISCWDAKYTFEYVRPVTQINLFFESTWQPFLQTPPFPEYTCGHCTISGSASTVLTHLFGENFAFHDNSDQPYIGLSRDFTSFSKAAEEAGISRMLGGLHYKHSIDVGLATGRKVGQHLIEKVGL